MKQVIMVALGMLMLAGCSEAPKSSGQDQSPAAASQTAAVVKESPEAASEKYVAEGRTDLQSGDIVEAIRNFDNAIRQNPRNTGAYMVLGETYLHVRNYDKAIDTLTAALIVDPRNGSANYLLAMAYNLRGDKDLALQHAQKSTQIFQDAKDAENFKKSLILLQGLIQANGVSTGKI